jgi:hypothetical protein
VYLKKILLRCLQVITIFCLTSAATSCAAQSEKEPEVFTFATGYRVETPTPRNFVEYGVVRKCGTSWCANVEKYDSAKLLPRVPTKYVHKMETPYGDHACVNGPISRVAKDVIENGKTQLRVDGNGISFQIKDFRYHWIADEKVQNGYTLAEITVTTTNKPLEQSVGFAFSSDTELVGDVLPEQVIRKYRGEIYAKTAFTRVDGQWELKPSIIDLRLFNVVDDGAVLSLTEPGLPAVVKKYGGPMWVQNSIVLKRNSDVISPLIQEYGHDFNRDGCFNESGHNKMMLPVADADKSVRALIYVEYTSDYERKFPMMSVGRYYR